MAYSWSHTPEAYDNARDQVEAKSKDWLEVVFAEWRAAYKDQPGSFSGHKYRRALEFARTLTEDAMANDVWDRMSEQGLCDHGGFNAWACPYNCHTVPFAPVREEEETPDAREPR